MLCATNHHTNRHTAKIKFFFVQQQHTVAAALRTALEGRSDGLEFVACTHLHPLDEHIEVEAPSEDHVRGALLDVKDALRHIRLELLGPPDLPPSRAAMCPPRPARR